MKYTIWYIMQHDKNIGIYNQTVDGENPADAISTYNVLSLAYDVWEIDGKPVKRICKSTNPPAFSEEKVINSVYSIGKVEYSGITFESVVKESLADKTSYLCKGYKAGVC